MDVTNAKSARQLAQAWSQEGPRGARMLRRFAEDQRTCAGLGRDLGRPVSERGHLAAARVLDRAAARMEQAA